VFIGKTIYLYVMWTLGNCCKTKTTAIFEIGCLWQNTRDHKWKVDIRVSLG